MSTSFISQTLDECGNTGGFVSVVFVVRGVKGEFCHEDVDGGGCLKMLCGWGWSQDNFRRCLL